MKNKHKLMNVMSLPRQQRRFFGQISRKPRSKLPRCRRQQFSRVLINSCSLLNICSGNDIVPVELSDCSCVLSKSIVDSSKRNEVVNNLKIVVSFDSVTFDYRRNGADECEVESSMKSEISSLINCKKPNKFENASLKLAENNVIPINSVNLGENEVVSINLECAESFDESSTSHTYSSTYSSIYLDNSEIADVPEEYTPSIWYDGSQFSDKWVAEACPNTFQLLNEFRRQFYRSSLILDNGVPDFHADDVILLGLEDEEDQESYKMLKSRERKQLYLRDYASEYCSTHYGQLIIEQRLEMVNWIFDHSTCMGLEGETMFLGINLLDRFFSKGYFKTKRTLQIAGIACLTLATKIEENHPYNSIRQKTFYVGNTPYSRCEVVAMEWLVQEILNFQCFLPTMYNFLWFYLKAVKANDAVGKTVQYLARLSILTHEQLCYWPSTVAASLVIIACKAAGTDAHCHLLIESLSREKDDTLPECIKRLEWLVKYC